MMNEREVDLWHRRSLKLAFIANVAFKVWLFRLLIAQLS
jgi:hypothetical protein